MKDKIKVNDVVQINPNSEKYKPKFAGMLLVVTEVKDWGVQGYLMAPYHFDAVRVKETMKAYLRTPWDEISFVGTLPYPDKEESQ